MRTKWLEKKKMKKLGMTIGGSLLSLMILLTAFFWLLPKEKAKQKEYEQRQAKAILEPVKPVEKQEFLVKESPAVDPSFFKTALLIGDSRTEGLLNTTDILADGYTEVGLTVASVFEDKIVKLDGNKVTVPTALTQKHYDNIYIMLGVNELGWRSLDTFAENYGELIDEIKKTQPQANIYIQSILPVTERKNYDPVYNNGRIFEFNSRLIRLAKDKQVYYLNVAEAVKNKEEMLPDEASRDGIHLNQEYCQKWYAYLKTHTMPKKGEF